MVILINSSTKKNNTEEEMVETQFIRPEACVTQSPACCPPASGYFSALSLFPSGESAVYRTLGNQEFSEML